MTVRVLSLGRTRGLFCKNKLMCADKSYSTRQKKTTLVKALEGEAFGRQEESNLPERHNGQRPTGVKCAPSRKARGWRREKGRLGERAEGTGTGTPGRGQPQDGAPRKTESN